MSGGDPQVDQPLTPTVAAVNAVERLSVWPEPDNEDTLVPFGAVMGSNVVAPV